MPPKPKCTAEQKQKIIDKLINRVPIVTILKDMKNIVGATTIYRIRSEYQAEKAKADDLTQSGQGESIEKAIDSRGKRFNDPMTCCNCKIGFYQYGNEDNKRLCSYECLIEYKTKDLPSMADTVNPYPSLVVRHDTSEFRDWIIE